MPRLPVIAAALLLLPSCLLLQDGDGKSGGGGGPGGGFGSDAEYAVALCEDTHAEFVDWGCSSGAFDCARHIALYERAGCLAEEIGWLECINEYVYDQCAQGCDYNPSLDCLIAYCSVTPSDTDCPTPPPPP